MRVSSKFLACMAAVAIPGCVYYVPAPSTATNTPPAATVQPQSDYVAPPPPRPDAQTVAVVPAEEPPAYQPPPVEVAPVYQDDLAPYGHWIVYPRYGRCWVPDSVPYGWQPYTVGHWIETDQGWCWVAEDREAQWGGIVYHYGQWAFTSDSGWIWVPGTTWAPAWVGWREGDGYCGWTPLPPEACQGEVTVVVVDRYCPPERYVYCDEHHFGEDRVDRRIVRNNVTIINNTTNITNVTIVNNRVINRGVSSDHIEHATGVAVRRQNVVEANSAVEARRLSQQGTPVHFATPAIETVHTQVQTERNEQIQKAQEQKRQEVLQKQTEHNEQVQQRKVDVQQTEEKARADSEERQQAHAKAVEEAQQAERQKATERAQAIEAQRQAARNAQVERAQQVEQQRQAARDAQAQREQQIEAAKQAARDAAAANHEGEPSGPGNQPNGNRPGPRGKQQPGQSRSPSPTPQQ